MQIIVDGVCGSRLVLLTDIKAIRIKNFPEVVFITHRSDEGGGVIV